MSLPVLYLKKNADRRLRRGHLWIYSNEVDTSRSPLVQFALGEQVLIASSAGKTLGVAFINPNNLICGRLVSRTERPLNRKGLVKRLQSALSLRDALYSDNSYRLVFGDSDNLPGLVVDRFGDHCVVQIGSAGMESMKDDLMSALDEVLSPKGVLLKNNGTVRKLEDLPEYVEEGLGEVPEFVPLVENGVSLEAPVWQGQKTGWFYDHRDNRQQLLSLVKGKRVLDVFSYAGAWSVQCLAAGASEVHAVDASGAALDWAQRNAEINHAGERLHTWGGNAADVLKAMLAEGERFDVVILDPPAFIKRRKDKKQGEKAYYQINQLGMRLVEQGGFLVSASCSMHLPKEDLREIVRSAARHVDREAQIIHSGGQGADHPILPAIPETDYLKSELVRVYR
ncbi:MAG: class I SAM-dependent rRNA methyltransferase [Cellvibrionaceae bacterium]